jgi:hypothetical protein
LVVQPRDNLHYGAGHRGRWGMDGPLRTLFSPSKPTSPIDLSTSRLELGSRRTTRLSQSRDVPAYVGISGSPPWIYAGPLTMPYSSNMTIQDIKAGWDS